MLRGVARNAVPVCLAAITINVLVRSPASLVQGALPPGAEDEIVLIEHLPGRRVHLRDFFWTGAEDAPPWLDPDQTLNLHETRTTIHRTATVRVSGQGIPASGDGDGEAAQDPRLAPRDPACVSCIRPTQTITETDRDIGVLVGEDPGPRYWLLTVLRSGESVPSRVELRLARLYRAAFSRQQQRHLGLLTNDPRLRRATEHRAPVENRRSIVDRSNVTDARGAANDNDRESDPPSGAAPRAKSIETRRARRPKISKSIDSVGSAIVSALTEVTSGPSVRIDFSPFNISTGRPVDPSVNDTEKRVAIAWVLDPRVRRYETNDSPGRRVRSESFTEDSRSGESSRENIVELVGASSVRTLASNSSNSKLRSLNVGTVQIRMQNTSITETGGTRLVYSVHLGGKPVPAETAAKDMALLSPQEVALELGVPVIVQSEPYLKETRPLALSRKRDAWLLVGAAGAAFILLALVIAALVIAAKKKRARSAVSAPPLGSILKKDRGYGRSSTGLDNTGYTSETEARTDGTSQRQTPGSQSRSPITPLTPESLEDDTQESSSDNEDKLRRAQSAKPWDVEEYHGSVEKSRKPTRRRVTRTEAMNHPRTPDSMDRATNEEENLESPEDVRTRKLEETASPHSYLSMPSCKLFPSMRSVEPLSKILEPVIVRHLDLELDTPEMARRDNGVYRQREERLSRAKSVHKDPGVVGPIVWDIRRQRSVEESGTSETEVGEGGSAAGPVGRARRRLHELLEDSFSLFATKDAKSREPACFSSRPSSAARSRERPLVTAFTESRGKSAHVSPVGTPVTQPKARPYTSLPRGENEETAETGNAAPHARGAWGSRPLSAGPFHRPNLPEIDVNRILADHRLSPEDPAVPLIAAIKKELDKFIPET